MTGTMAHRHCLFLFAGCGLGVCLRDNGKAGMYLVPMPDGFVAKAAPSFFWEHSRLCPMAEGLHCGRYFLKSYPGWRVTFSGRATVPNAKTNVMVDRLRCLV